MFFLLSTLNPTFKADIKPIFKKRCSVCHNAYWADKNWLDYNIVKKNKELIRFRVNNETMPPNNTTLMTKNERDLIIKWIDQGVKE
jgi:uncharacterized membrane protein